MNFSRVFPALLLLSLLALPSARPLAAEAEAKAKTAVRIVTLKGAYEDHPATPGLDPFTLFSGDFEKPGSFFALCDKLDELAKSESIQHVLFDLSAMDLQLNQAQLAE